MVLIVGRDHAGVGDYYGPFDAHHIFDELWDGIATGRTCPHGEEDRLGISGIQLREMFANAEPIPKEFSRPEVLDVLRAYYDALK